MNIESEYKFYFAVKILNIESDQGFYLSYKFYFAVEIQTHDYI